MTLKQWLDFAVAIGTGLLALATFGLAWFTKTMASEAKCGQEQDARHHRENLRPFCVLEFKEADASHPFGAEFTPNAAMAALYPSTPPETEVWIKGHLVNKGLGPAKDVVVYLNRGSSVEGQAYWLTHPVVVCGFIAAGESIEVAVEITEQNVASTVTGGQRVRIQDLAAVAQDAYEVVLRYTDIFDSVFRTVHARGFPQNLSAEVAAASGDKAKAEALSVRQNRPTPVFLKEEQKWQTLADMPRLQPDSSSGYPTSNLNVS